MMKWLNTKSVAFGIAAVASLGFAGQSATGSAKSIAAPDNILQTCEEANVSLLDLAIGSEGKGTKTYYNGNVQMVQIDQVEPAAASSGVVILAMLPDSEMGERVCLAATQFNYLDLDKAKSFYDRGSGLNVTIPAMDYDPETSMSVSGKPLSIKINLGKGEFKASR